MNREPSEVLADLKKAIYSKDKVDIQKLIREFMDSLTEPLTTADLASALKVNRATVDRWLSLGTPPNPSALFGFEKLVAKSGGDIDGTFSVEDLEYLITIVRGLDKPIPVNLAVGLVRLRKK